MSLSTFQSIKEAASDGKIFSLVFIKKDGTLRRMKCRTGVSKYRKTVGEYIRTVAQPDLITVFDMDKKQYRSFHQSSVLAVTMKGEVYNVLM